MTDVDIAHLAQWKAAGVISDEEQVLWSRHFEAEARAKQEKEALQKRREWLAAEAKKVGEAKAKLIADRTTVLSELTREDGFLVLERLRAEAVRLEGRGEDIVNGLEAVERLEMKLNPLCL